MNENTNKIIKLDLDDWNLGMNALYTNARRERKTIQKCKTAKTWNIAMAVSRGDSDRIEANNKLSNYKKLSPKNNSSKDAQKPRNVNIAKTHCNEWTSVTKDLVKINKISQINGKTDEWEHQRSQRYFLLRGQPSCLDFYDHISLNSNAVDLHWSSLLSLLVNRSQESIQEWWGACRANIPGVNHDLNSQV